ncbi:MAG: hypothetical protein ACRDRS_02150, partial [Pseudonocardiaceae bacterium]
MSTPGVGAEGLALYEPADVVIADALPEDDRKLFHRPIENFSNCQTKANTLASWISVLEKPDVSTAVFVATSYSGCPEPNGGPASLFRSSEDRWATNISAARPVNGRIRSAATAVWAELMNRYGRLVRSTVA